ncbi:5-beta-cholestane-3-alpha,7-alpha-diol 12-alpha-hydroxylase [Spea bombifrons]|uniref:5-beta-cholestane-3-alpha,7-alpha-diol 12-alpha-hydroxylase n=1 Tax=Spea bombifrons TaxID=233779 RepID=UPI00234BE193|nr:5-beta-cholestane-3-alpha,7-alpha-diol 12-alpha-hydroxylase [Spea bombifrons]XP_053323577.1 5-beta-cholestane-3-alpha,7-alpha-diol 12-alpha-hydroxylase [Spea bombifrons]XP_053323578.1 5-beta-cholestane-3-alpha,7-alpha-diol 12-alpha-hydroxylase [Spea bombifrons]
MALLFSILAALVICAITGLYMLGMFRKRRPNEPPLDKGTIPWLGYALDFRNNSAVFLQKMQKKHGDIFTVQIAGYYFTFVMDPLSFAPIVKEARSKLDFEQFAQELVARVFGYHSIYNDHKVLERSSTKYLMGDGLVVMTQAMMENLQNLMLHDVGSGNGERKWHEDGLFNYSYNIVFRAGYLALFGNEPAKSKGNPELAKKFDRDHSEELFHEFRKYDRLFPRLAYAVLPPKDKLEAERLKRLFWNMLSVKNTMQKENISGWITEQYQHHKENGVSEQMQDRFMFLLLWASQGNTGPACFWLLLYLMKDPEAMKAVYAEVQSIIKETGQEIKAGGPLLNLTRDMLLKTPVLDSAVEETLRLTAAPVLIRAVKENMSIKMANGKEYAMRKGDRVALFPYIAVQMDPEVHPEPEKFKYDRFLNEDGTKKSEFYKNGKRLKYFTMPWGAGSTICPGRFFAINELKQFVFLMLSYFEFELLNPDEENPDIDPNRWGFGSMQPTRDVRFKYRLRY